MRFVGDNLIRGDANRWEMVAQKCATCGTIAYPKKRVCPECFGAELDDLVLSKNGTLHTFTVTHLGPPELPTPYILGFIDLPEGLKVMAQILADDPLDHGLRVGDAMDVVLARLRTDPDGVDVYSYKFQQAGGAR